MRILPIADSVAASRLIGRRVRADARVEREASRIVADVRRRGDAAVREWSRRLDGWQGRIAVSPAEIERGWRATPPPIRSAIRHAIRHVERVAVAQVPRPLTVNVSSGVTIRQRVTPLEFVGCYVPGGRYPLVSTVVMTVTPARVAGVRDITIACPRPTAAICCAALEAGATRVLRIGGAQAIASLAYGTRSIRRVDKIVGPGNAWVTAAKRIVSTHCGVDLQAGPSEILIWSDRGRPDWIAIDLIAQAEHDPDARALCVTTRPRLAAAVAAEVARLLPGFPEAAPAMARNGAVLVAASRREAIDTVNRIAPEHLVCDNVRDAARVTHAGTVFIGDWSAQAAGDYCTGSNHVLPTGAAARHRGGLTTADFVRTTTWQTLTAAGLTTIATSAIALAEAEGLRGHAASLRCRIAETTNDRSVR
jgi:histidinol dehydrogenase